MILVRLPRWLRGKESIYQCRKHRLDPWVTKFPWRRKWKPTPVFLPGKFHGQRSLGGAIVHGVAKSQRPLSDWAAAAAAKSLQSCPTLCDPIDSSLPGSPIPGILQARILEWVAMSFSNVWKWKVKVKLLSRVRLLMTPWTAAHQAPPCMGFSRQEYWSGVSLPSLQWLSTAQQLVVNKPFQVIPVISLKLEDPSAVDKDLMKLL